MVTPRDTCGQGRPSSISGRAEESIAALEQSLRLDPLWNPHNFAVLGHAYCMAGRCEKAIQTLRRGAKLKPNLIAFQIFQALAQARKGDMAAAQAAAIKALEINPNFTLTAYANFMPYKNRVDEEQDVGDMRKAGLPE